MLLSSPATDGPADERTPRWYVAEVNPQKEALATERVNVMGFRSFCPRFSKWTSHARRRRCVQAPLFPGYIFIEFDPDSDDWGRVRVAPGVRRLIGSKPHTPQSISNAVIEGLLRRFGDGANEKHNLKLNVGDQVYLNHPSIPRQMGIIESLTSDQRIVLLLSLIGKETRVRVNSSMVSTYI